jgi:pilus assembly protein CpaB
VNKRFLAVLGFALVVSLIASTVVYRLIMSRAIGGNPQSGQKMVVATHDLEVGTLLKAEDLKSVDWSGPVSPQWVTRPEDAVGRGVVANVYKDEPLISNRLAATGAGAGMAATIPPGMRAMGVRVDEVVGLAGFVMPGMRVDVIISGNPPTETQALGTITRTALQNIEVLSAGQNIQRDQEGKPVTVQVVNLLVTPEQAEILSLASKETKIQLVLRNPLDRKETKTPGTATALLFKDRPTGLGTVQASAPRPAAPPRRKEKKLIVEKVSVPLTMEIIHGQKKDTSTVGQRVEERTREVVQ